MTVRKIAAMNTDETRRRILTRGRQHFFAFGLGRTTMQEIALSAGVSKKTLYLNYKSKPELFKCRSARARV